ncbi:GFA family protein [Seohaeicola zhoushanensis]
MTDLHGECLCGAVAYQVPDRFAYALNCHCSQCRRATGAAFKPFAGIPLADLRITRGAHKLTSWGDDQGQDRRCGTCGSLLWSVVRDGAWAHVTMGTLMDTLDPPDGAYLHRLEGALARDHRRPAAVP